MGGGGGRKKRLILKYIFASLHEAVKRKQLLNTFQGKEVYINKWCRVPPPKSMNSNHKVEISSQDGAWQASRDWKGAGRKKDTPWTAP